MGAQLRCSVCYRYLRDLTEKDLPLLNGFETCSFCREYLQRASDNVRQIARRSNHEIIALRNWHRDFINFVLENGISEEVKD